MFTGLIEEIGQIRAITKGNGSAKLTVAAQKVLADCKIGDSIAVNGVCLTVVDLQETAFTAEAMPETLARANLGALVSGQKVNLERAVALGTRLGGHLVSGHIDGTATIKTCSRADIAVVYELQAPQELLRYMVEKGSVALDGTSLTVTEVARDTFSVALIPHTGEQSVLGLKISGDTVNVEVDMIAKYVEKFCRPAADSAQPLGYEFLAENGFL